METNWRFNRASTGRYSENPGEVREDPQRTSTASPRSPPTWQFLNMSFARLIAWQEEKRELFAHSWTWFRARMTESLSFLVIEIKADMFSFVILAIEQRLTDLTLKHLFCMVWSNSWSPLTGMEKVANVCVQVLVWSVTPSSSFSSFPPFSHPHHLSCYCCCCCQSLSHC